MQLITIPFSHFCEKARWGLDRAGLSYVEKGYAPVIHRMVVMPRGSKTTPVLVDGRRIVRGSSAILAHCDSNGHAPDPLYPPDPAIRRDVDELVARFDEQLGPTTRLWLYAWAVEDRERLMRFASLGLAPGQQRRLQRMLPVLERVLRSVLQIRPDSRERSALATDEEFAFVSERLSDGRPFLAGDSFTAADLTFAALAAPVLMPSGYGGAAIRSPTPPPELAGDVARWRDTPAGRHGIAMYRYRPAPR